MRDLQRAGPTERGERGGGRWTLEAEGNGGTRERQGISGGGYQVSKGRKAIPFL